MKILKLLTVYTFIAFAPPKYAYMSVSDLFNNMTASADVVIHNDMLNVFDQRLKHSSCDTMEEICDRLQDLFFVQDEQSIPVGISNKRCNLIPLIRALRDEGYVQALDILGQYVNGSHHLLELLDTQLS